MSAAITADEARAMARAYDERAEAAERAGDLSRADRLRGHARRWRTLTATAALPSQVRAVSP